MSQQEIEEALDRGLLEVNIREGKWWKVRRNGKTQTWKTRPNDYRIPAKTGFRTTFQITFAEEAHHSRSNQYEFIPTWEVIKRMNNEGFFITLAQQARTRVEGKREFTKHLIRFRHNSHKDWDSKNTARVGDTTFEIILLNSHDGTSSYRLDAGLFKLVCLNVMVVSDGTFPSIHIHHKGRIADNVIDASYKVIEEAPKVMNHVKRWKNILLTKNEQELFAEYATKLRFEVDTISDSPITPIQLLTARRFDDNRPDLWNTFNRVQEN